MKKIVRIYVRSLLAVHFLVFVTLCVIAIAATAAEKNIRTLTHYSKYLKKEQKLDVYVPDSGGKHNVLYLLHGATGSYVDWVLRTDLKDIADKYNLLIVMPDGGAYSWYSDSPMIRDSQYESYIVKELIPFIDSCFATYAQKKGRGVCGLSMGGYGAIKFGLKYPELFSSASSLSGVLTIMKHPDKWSLAMVLGEQADHLANWKREDLVGLAESAKDSSVALKFDTGVDDITLDDNRAFVSVLQELRRTFEYAEFPGEHNWTYWGSHIDEHLNFHARHLLKGGR